MGINSEGDRYKDSLYLTWNRSRSNGSGRV